MNCQKTTITSGWYTARELAGLPGMPQSVSGVIRKAKAQAWETQKRMQRGGGYVYSRASLPLQTQLALLGAEERDAFAGTAKELRELADRHQAMADQLRRHAGTLYVAAKEGRS